MVGHTERLTFYLQVCLAYICVSAESEKLCRVYGKW